MNFVIRILNVVTGSATPTPFDGQYLVEYDPEHDGESPDGKRMIAVVRTDPDPANAKLYGDAAEAHAEWARICERMPTRPDGKPNRPLTAFSIEVVTHDAAVMAYQRENPSGR